MSKNSDYGGFEYLVRSFIIVFLHWISFWIFGTMGELRIRWPPLRFTRKSKQVVKRNLCDIYTCMIT